MRRGLFPPYDSMLEHSNAEILGFAGNIQFFQVLNYGDYGCWFMLVLCFGLRPIQVVTANREEGVSWCR